MRHPIVLVSFFLSMVGVGGAAAGESADSALQTALAHNPRIQALKAEAAVARAEGLESRLLPPLDADFAMRQSGGDRHWDLGVMADVNGLLFYPWSRGAGGARERSALSRLSAELSAQHMEVKQAWYEAIASEQVRRSAAEALATWEAAAELARRQKAAGTMNALDVTEMEAAATTARLDLRTAESRAADARDDLAKVLGVSATASAWNPQDSLWDSLPAPSGEDPDLETVVRLAASRNEGLRAAREERDALDRAHTVSVLNSFPTFKAGVSVERDEAGRNFIGPAVSAEIPLFDLGIGKRARSRAEREVGRRRVAVAETDLASEVRQAHRAMTTARRNYALLADTLLPQREKVAAETLKQYNFMLAGVYRLLEARREVLAAQTRAIESLRDYWIARADIERLTGETP